MITGSRSTSGCQSWVCSKIGLWLPLKETKSGFESRHTHEQAQGSNPWISVVLVGSLPISPIGSHDSGELIGVVAAQCSWASSLGVKRLALNQLTRVRFPRGLRNGRVAKPVKAHARHA